jgi:hypothetical protein
MPMNGLNNPHPMSAELRLFTKPVASLTHPQLWRIIGAVGPRIEQRKAGPRKGPANGCMGIERRTPSRKVAARSQIAREPEAR